MKKLSVLIALLLSVLLLTSCSLVEQHKEKRAEELVRGNIEAVYRGVGIEEFSKLVTESVEEVEQIHLDFITAESEGFAYYWGILLQEEGEVFTDLDPALQNEIMELNKEIYQGIQYEVLSAETVDGGWDVKLKVSPINVMEKALEMYHSGEYAPLQEKIREYEESDWTQAGDEFYWQWTNEYGAVIVDMVREALTLSGCGEAVEVTVLVEQGEFLAINQEDWDELAFRLITVPMGE